MSCVTNVLNFSDWNALTFGGAKFQVDVKEGKGGLWSDLNVHLTITGEEVNRVVIACAANELNCESVHNIAFHRSLCGSGICTQI